MSITLEEPDAVVFTAGSGSESICWTERVPCLPNLQENQNRTSESQKNTNDPSAPSYGPRGVDPVPLAVVDLNVGILQPGESRTSVPQEGHLPIMHLQSQEVLLMRITHGLYNGDFTHSIYMHS